MMRRRILLAGMLAASNLAAHGQGCSQCRDNAAAELPETRAAYRHAIVLMVMVAGGVFGGSVLLLRRSR